MSTDLRNKLIGYIQSAHAMEENVLRMLDSMISTTSDQTVVNRLKQHKLETQRHEQMLRDRLEALGTKPSTTAEITAMASAMLKGVGDQVRTDKPGKNARDGFVTEHLEIASYELMERLAQRAGDQTTAQLARDIRKDEEAMASWISDNWDRFIDLTLEEAGLAQHT